MGHRAMKTLVLLLAMCSVAHADDLMVRILADRAQVHTGPGFGYRTIYTAERGEVLRAVERATRGYWFRVILPDGTYGWVLGDEVFPFDVDVGAKYHEPGIFARMGDALFAPSPLGDGVVEFTFSAGILGGDGMFLFRPAILLDPHVGIEAFFGESLGNQTDVLYYGAGANAYLWPASPVTPFFALGGGGVTSRKKADQFTVRVGDFSTANVGGGMMFAFKKRVTLRFDFRNHIIFDPNHINSAQEYSGGLAIVF
jgi:hypothetical protein